MMDKIFTNPRKNPIKLFILLTFLLLSNLIGYGQAPQLIPVDAANNKYPIIFTTNEQNEFVLEFDQVVIGGTDPSCWTVKIGTDEYTPFSVSTSGNFVFLEL